MLLVDILCKIVDNFGDAGVALRLARALSALDDPPSIRLVIDDLSSFSLLEPGVDTLSPLQEHRGWTIIRWDGGGGQETDGGILEEYRKRPPRVVVESLACGRPDWLESLLFSGDGEATIIDLEHLTAEGFAKDIHGMPSLTRSPVVKKWMFFPGFEGGTGGLIQDPEYLEALDGAKTALGRARLRRRIAAPFLETDSLLEAFWVLIFSYERDFSAMVRDLGVFSRKRPLLVVSASGKSQEPLSRAWEAAGRPFPLLKLPFLSQEDWDRFIAASDFSIIRGEDSLSRACLAGRPFLWQAYPQAGKHHLVKVSAFMGLLASHGRKTDLEAIFASLQALNERDVDSPTCLLDEGLLTCLESQNVAETAFSSLAASIRSQGDLAATLMTFIREKV